MEKEELKDNLLELIAKEKSLTKVCEEINLNEYEMNKDLLEKAKNSFLNEEKNKQMI